jgi:hypothetical protein
VVGRIWRGYGIFTEVEEEIYKHSPLSLKLATPPLSLNVLPLAARNLSGMSKLPEYLANTSYRNPGDDPSAKSLFRYSNNTDLEFFQSLQTKPAALKTFNTSMAKSVVTERARAGKGLVDIYPFKTLGEALSSPDETVFVDVGGGQGQVLQDIRTHVPELACKKMVLEDLPKTVEDHLPQKNVDFVPYDFLTAEQPVNGARAYLLRHILHDWPDRIYCQIFLSTIPALVKGKSKILMVEIILPPMNPPIFGALMDIQMMNYGGGGRKERQWRAIFELVRLEIMKIWPTAESDSVMELVLKSS